MIGFMDIIEIRKYEDDVTDEMLLILEKVADELKLARDKVFDDRCQEYGTANILKQCDHLSADINEYLNLRKIIFAKTKDVYLDEKVFDDVNGSQYRIFKNSNNEYLLCKSSENGKIKYTITDDELSEIDSGLMAIDATGSYYVDLFSDRLYNKTLQITSDNKDILIKNLFEFSEFASDEYLELSGNEEEIKKFYNIFGEYLR